MVRSMSRTHSFDWVGKLTDDTQSVDDNERLERLLTSIMLRICIAKVSEFILIIHDICDEVGIEYGWHILPTNFN